MTDGNMDGLNGSDLNSILPLEGHVMKAKKNLFEKNVKKEELDKAAKQEVKHVEIPAEQKSPRPAARRVKTSSPLPDDVNTTETATANEQKRFQEEISFSEKPHKSSTESKIAIKIEKAIKSLTVPGEPSAESAFSKKPVQSPRKLNESPTNSSTPSNLPANTEKVMTSMEPLKSHNEQTKLHGDHTIAPKEPKKTPTEPSKPTTDVAKQEVKNVEIPAEQKSPRPAVRKIKVPSPLPDDVRNTETTTANESKMFKEKITFPEKQREYLTVSGDTPAESYTPSKSPIQSPRKLSESPTNSITSSNNPVNTEKVMPSNEPLKFPDVQSVLDDLSIAPAEPSTPLAEEVYRFLIVGKTGSGKSTTGNTILGTQEQEADHFPTSPSFMPVTYDCELKRATDNGRTIEIMDSPGFFDVTRSNDEISNTIVQAVVGMHPGPQAVLFVVKIDRFTDEEYAAYQKFKAVFDADIMKYIIIIFTGGDKLERKGKTIDDMTLPPNLQQVMKECQRRFVVFNNRADDKKPQVEKLLELVKSVQKQNGDIPYSCSKYCHVQMAVEEEVDKRVSILEESITKKTEEEKDKLEVELRKAEEAIVKLRKKLATLEAEEREEMRKRQQEKEARLVEKRGNVQEDEESDLGEITRDSIMIEKNRRVKKEKEKFELELAEKLERNYKILISEVEGKRFQRIREARQRELNQIKDEIITNEDIGFLNRCVKFVRNLFKRS